MDYLVHIVLFLPSAIKAVGYSDHQRRAFGGGVLSGGRAGGWTGGADARRCLYVSGDLLF